MFAKLQARYIAPRKSRTLRRLEEMTQPLDPAVYDKYEALRDARPHDVKPSREERKLEDQIAAHESFNTDPLTADLIAKETEAYEAKVAKRIARLAAIKARVAQVKAVVRRLANIPVKAVKVVTKVVVTVAKALGYGVAVVVGTVLALPVLALFGLYRACRVIVGWAVAMVTLTFTSLVELVTSLWSAVVDLVCSPFLVSEAVISAWRGRKNLILVLRHARDTDETWEAVKASLSDPGAEVDSTTTPDAAGAPGDGEAA